VQWRLKSRIAAAEPQRDPQLGRLLGACAPQRNLLAWSEVEQLVASAPPVRVSWTAALLSTGARPLRYALAALILLGAGPGVLAVMPAHSDVVGTTVLTSLPGEWPVAGPAFNEMEQAAAEQFAALKLPQGDMFVKVGPARGKQQLAFALLGAERQDAERFFVALQDKYPTLRVTTPSYEPIDTERSGNRLHELVLSILKPQVLEPLAPEALKAYVLKSLKQCGFDDIQIKVYRGADGTTFIEVDARMKFAVTGRTQEELEQSGLSERVVGGEVFRQLLKGTGAPNPD
jgi:hypothetical protein